MSTITLKKTEKTFSVSDSLTDIAAALTQQVPKKERKYKGKFYSDTFTGETWLQFGLLSPTLL